MAVAFFAPSTAEEAVAALAGPGRAVALAGGTDLLPDLEDGRASADRIVSLTRLPWSTLGRPDGRLRIGSTLPMRTLERDPHLQRDLPGLYTALRSVGSVPLRHRATVGGNLARGSPASDLLPILLALDAQIDLIRRGDAAGPPSRSSCVHRGRSTSAPGNSSKRSRSRWRHSRPMFGSGSGLRTTSPRWA